MAFSTVFLAFNSILLLALLLCIIFLQIFLSKRAGRLPGLIMPLISLLFSFIYPLNMTVAGEGLTLSFVVSMLAVWALANIPTFILMAIYWAQRDKLKQFQELDKMKVQDL